MIVFFFLLSFSLGLIFLKLNIVISLIITIAYFVYLLFYLRSKKIIIFLAVFVIGFIVPLIPLTNNQTTQVYDGVVIEAKDNYFLFQSKFEKFYVYEASNSREIGDFLKISSKAYELKITSYESQFSFKTYLANKGVKRQLYSSKIVESFHNPIRLKAFRQGYLANCSDDIAPLIDAFLFCNKDYSNSIISFASEMNILFLLSMSGIYLHFLLNLLKKLFSLFLNEKIADIIPFIILTPYLIFTFPKIGILKVSILYVLKYLNKYFLKNKFNNLEITSFLAILFLLIDYHLIYQEGFYLSFIFSFLILLFYPLLTNFKKKHQKLIVPFLFYLFILPITNLINGSIHIFSFIFEILLIPINEIFISFSLLSFYLYIPFNNILGFITFIMSFIYKGFLAMDITLPIGDYIVYLLPLYYALYFYICYLLESKRKFHVLKPTLSLSSIIVISLIPIRLYLTNAIYFINVGQGDSILIKNKNNIVLIDTGGVKSNDLAKNSLIPFFNKKQIFHIDYLITTHNDYDHSGAASSLINNFPVYNYLNNSSDFPIKIGDIYLENINNYKGEDENDNSLVFNLDFMGKKWLLMGDASINVENYLINNNYDIDCDILKIGHHGSKTSSSEAFLKKCTPIEAIISVGEKNSYGHPSDEVISLLNKYNVSIRRTDLEGTIMYLQFVI